MCVFFITRKRKDKHKENEAIQFDFDMNRDAPENVAQEMVSAEYTFLCGFINKEILKKM